MREMILDLERLLLQAEETFDQGKKAEANALLEQISQLFLLVGMIAEAFPDKIPEDMREQIGTLLKRVNTFMDKVLMELMGSAEFKQSLLKSLPMPEREEQYKNS